MVLAGAAFFAAGAAGFVAAVFFAAGAGFAALAEAFLLEFGISKKTRRHSWRERTPNQAHLPPHARGDFPGKRRSAKASDEQ
jgi:hypothetical protein